MLDLDVILLELIFGTIPDQGINCTIYVDFQIVQGCPGEKVGVSPSWHTQIFYKNFFGRIILIPHRGDAPISLLTPMVDWIPSGLNRLSYLRTTLSGLRK